MKTASSIFAPGAIKQKRYRSKFCAQLVGHPPFLCRCTRGHICDGACPPSSAAVPIPPVALAYTTLAWGSLLCRSSTALPILVELAFLALWHSSNTIWDMLG